MAVRARVQDYERLYTAEEFEQLPEFGEDYDLIDGRLVKRPMSSGRHSKIAKLILLAYDRFDPDEKVGIMLQEASIRLEPGNVPKPDVSFWKAERNISVDDTIMPRPDLAVEVHSPSDLKSPSDLV